MSVNSVKKCDGCSTRECEYIELIKFIEEYNNATGKKYELADCPDKSGLAYTCDLLFKDESTKESLYIEMKEVRFGVGEKEDANKLLGENRGQNECADLVYDVITDTCDEAVQKKLCEYAINIPRVKIYNSEKQEFRNKLAEMLIKADFKSDPFTFCFEGKNNKIEIVFHKKDEKMKKFGDRTLYEFECEENNTLDKIFDRFTDTNLLFKLINGNLKATSQKKFPPNTADKKLLLNVLVLPAGYDVFFNRNINYIINEIVNMVPSSDSGANESYLLYYCEDYMEFNNNTVVKYGDLLFVIPVIKGVFDKPIYF